MSTEPLAWLVSLDGKPLGSTHLASVAEGYLDLGGAYTVTPLVAAPPEDGRPTWDELAAALRNRVNNCSWCAYRQTICPQCMSDGALLSRIPKEEG